LDFEANRLRSHKVVRMTDPPGSMWPAGERHGGREVVTNRVVVREQRMNNPINIRRICVRAMFLLVASIWRQICIYKAGGSMLIEAVGLEKLEENSHI
jgi:hypothetical protein